MFTNFFLMYDVMPPQGHVAQLAEQGTLNPQVAGSIPAVLTNLLKRLQSLCL